MDLLATVEHGLPIFPPLKPSKTLSESLVDEITLSYLFSLETSPTFGVSTELVVLDDEVIPLKVISDSEKAYGTGDLEAGRGGNNIAAASSAVD